jgi:sensor c-di-GMP phosphodiesterase-like protein
VIRRSSLSTAVTVAAALLAVAIPVGLAIQLAGRQARAAEMQRVAAWAQAVLDRSETAARQVNAALDALVAANPADPCSPANLALMRQHALGSQYLKAIGHVVGERITCSSLGAGVEDLELGPVAADWISPAGIRIRPDARFPFDRRGDYLVVERDGYAAVVARDMAIDIALSAGDGEGASLATFSTFNGRVLVARGHVEPAWLAVRTGLPGERSIATFIKDDHVVAVAVSNRWYVGAVAAVPVGHIAALTHSTARVLLPVGALAGLMLAGAMFYWRRQQTSLPAILRLALKRNEFWLLYQPVVDLQTGQWVGGEALLRWRRPDGEMVPPDLFIPAAENAGMIRAITGRVLELVVQDLRGVAAREPGLHIAVNLSCQDLEASAGTLSALRRVAARTGLAPGNLLVEISERGLPESQAARAVLDEIRAAGFRVAIDDFGTGYSNLAHLANFTLDYLKIDKLFVDTMRGDGATSSVVPHIIEIARTLNLKVIAEGVETDEQVQFLKELGVQYAQGWLFGKPMEAEELLRGHARSRAAAAASGQDQQPYGTRQA